MRSYGPKRRTRRERDTAAFMLKTLTDETPVTQESFDARVEAMGRGVGR